jgi:hypothetical protein
MAGQIIPKGKGKWLVRVFTGRDPQTGKKKYYNKQVSGNKKKAQSFLNGVLGRDRPRNIRFAIANDGERIL